MVKLLTIYDTKYGSTKLVAEKIVKGLRQVQGIEVEINDVEGIDVERVAGFWCSLDWSTHTLWRPPRNITRFIDYLGRSDLKDKQTAVFNTYLGKDFEMGVKKMEQRIVEKKTSLHIMMPRLSVRVAGMEDSVAEEELPKVRDFGIRIADRLRNSEVQTSLR